VSTELLEQKITAKDQQAPRMARQLGPPAEPVIERAFANADWEVRDLAVECAYALGGPNRNPLFLKALHDEDINVRYTACRHLEDTADIRVLPQLLDEVKMNDDEKVRGQVALMIGRLDDKSAVEPLKERIKPEPDDEVRDNIVLALARLGEEDARAQIRADLQSGEVETRLETIRKYEYINDPDALVDLHPLLNDHANAVNIHPSNAPPYYLRICDIVVQVVTNTGKPKLPFDGTERRRFAPEERNEIAKWLAAKRR
jgi:HEAT repeat protein